MAFKVNEFRSHFSKYGEFAKSDKFEVRIAIPTILDSKIKTKDLTFQCEIAELPGRTINTIDFVHYGFTERTPHFTSYEPVTLTFYCNGEMTEKKFFDEWMNSMVPSESGLVSYGRGNTSLFTSTVDIIQYSQYAEPKSIGGDGEEEPISLSRVLKETAIRAAKDIGKSAIEKAAGVPFGGLKQILGLGNDSLVSQLQEPGKEREIYHCILQEAMPVAISPLSLSWADDSVQRLQVTFVYKKWSTKFLRKSITLTENLLDLPNDEDKLRQRGKDVISSGVDFVVNQGISKTRDIVLGKIKF